MKLIAKVLSAAILVLPFSAFAAYTITGVSTDVDASAGVTTHADSDVQVQVQGSANVDGHDNGGVKPDANIGSSGNDGVQVTTSVTGDPDFDLFAKTVTKEHADVQAVDVDGDGSVDVAYKHQGWLFGFIPVTVTSHTTVQSDTSGKAMAHVRLPWWSFLVSGVSAVKTDAEASLNGNADVQANASSQTMMDSRIKLVEVMVSSLSSADAKVKASWNVKENVK